MRRLTVIAAPAAVAVALGVLVDQGRLAALDHWARANASPLQAGPAGRGRGGALKLIAGATDALISLAGIAVAVILVVLAARRLVGGGRAGEAAADIIAGLMAG